ncbi:hypothetical protein CYMTET_41933 [Cymbomonas tetramitiformis]|uniref:Uncharacterized protein n=1 Tax=Cymbomonas tetramitiformis TaxID=36881 RepID=A0AAE0F210_9CHLO|nr:hypothetical protein CYMTET_41933 [Cymbomonas tetramitiformis]
MSRECARGGRSLLSRLHAADTSSVIAPFPRKVLNPNHHSSSTETVLLRVPRRSPSQERTNGRPAGWPIPHEAAVHDIMETSSAAEDENIFLGCSPPTRSGNPLVRDNAFGDRWTAVERNLSLTSSTGSNLGPFADRCSSTPPFDSVRWKA